MFFVTRIMSGDFCPESGGMVEMIEMCELMKDDIVAKRLGDLHEADIEGDGAVARTAAPASSGVAEAAFVVGVTIELCVVLETVGEIILSFFHEDFFLGVASALSLRVAKGDFLFDELAVDF